MRLTSWTVKFSVPRATSKSGTVKFSVTRATSKSGTVKFPTPRTSSRIGTVKFSTPRTISKLCTKSGKKTLEEKIKTHERIQITLNATREQTAVCYFVISYLEPFMCFDLVL